MDSPANPVASVKTFLTSNPSREEIVAYKFPDAIQQRLDYLLDLNAQDSLTIEQRVELDEIVNMDELITLIKAKIKSIPYIDLASLGMDMTPRLVYPQFSGVTEAQAALVTGATKSMLECKRWRL